MTTSTETRAMAHTLASRSAGRTALKALLIVVLLGIAAALVIIGLDALNDMLVRGFTSLPGSAG